MFETIQRNGELGGAEWKALMHGQEEQRVNGATGTVSDHHEAQLIAKRMREREAGYFSCIDQDMEATNTPAEMTIRQVALDRVVTQGSRGITGNEWHERFWSVLTTCTIQNTSVMMYLKGCLAPFFGFDSFPDYINLAESP